MNNLTAADLIDKLSTALSDHCGDNEYAWKLYNESQQYLADKAKLKEAKIGHTLYDDWTVVHKESTFIIVASKDYGPLPWNEINSVLEGLPPDCFIPSIDLLKMVAYLFPNGSCYWSSTSGYSNIYGVACKVWHDNDRSEMDYIKKNQSHLVKVFRIINL